jgi:ABC-type lipoprotein release transport system permease subunit
VASQHHLDDPYGAPEAAESASSDRSPPRFGCLFGCLFTFLGSLTGLGLGLWYDSMLFAQMRAEDPEVVIDFLPVTPFLGFIFGGLGGTVAAAVASGFSVSTKTRKPQASTESR